MALAYTFRVLENSARNYILQANAVDTSTTAVATTGTASNGIIAANGYTPTTHLKLYRVWYSIYNLDVRVQWHATTNVDIAIVSGGYGEMNFDEMFGHSTFVNNDGGAGVTGDIDIAPSYASNITTGGGVTASLSLTLFAIKGVSFP
jgi:hypothetical protein